MGGLGTYRQLLDEIRKQGYRGYKFAGVRARAAETA
jgi:hypothetical protein